MRTCVASAVQYHRRLPAIAAVLVALLVLPLAAVGQPAQTATPAPDEAAHELNKQLNNPVSSIWSLNFQSNFQFFEGRLTDEPRWQYNFNFQPVLPLHLTESWNLITRPIFPVFAGVDTPIRRRAPSTSTAASAT